MKDKWFYMPTNKGYWRLIYASIVEVVEYKPGEEPTEWTVFRKNTIYSATKEEEKEVCFSHILGYCSHCNRVTPLIGVKIYRQYVVEDKTKSLFEVPGKRLTIPFRYTPMRAVVCISCESKIKPEHLFLRKDGDIKGFFEFRGIEPDFSVLI